MIYQSITFFFFLCGRNFLPSIQSCIRNNFKIDSQKLPSQEYLAGLFLFHPEAQDSDWPGNKSCDTGPEFHSNSEKPGREIKWIFNQKQNTESGIHRGLFWTLTGLSNMKDCARRLLRKWSWANRMLSKSRVELICCKSCENWDSKTST